jgi:two-component system repressor protein LuxO
MAAPRVLLVEDQAALARTYQAYLRGTAFAVEHVGTGAAALAALADPPAAILLDLRLPDADGLELLQEIRRRSQERPVIVITAHGSMQTVIDAMRAGAADFLVKPFAAERLRVTLHNALERHALASQVRTYRERIDRQSFHGFIGSSLAMQAVYRALESAAASTATIFLTGESGTGKEVAAQAIHDLSGRPGRFVALNCAAIPRDLVESEIFGHVRGAFTGALAEREGAAQRADRGTLLLDEICEMPLPLQGKLLRFLQTGQVVKVGGGEVIPVDLRVVCATNRDPRAEVAAGRFREDLFYRLHVIPIELPPLRARGDDVLEIARHFFERYAAREGGRFERLTEAAAAALRRHRWPGNIRELQNVVWNTVVMSRAAVIDAPMLAGLAAGDGAAAAPLAPMARDLDRLAAQIRPLAEVERTAIEQALRLCGGDVRKAAVFLEVAPATIYRRLKSWGGGPAAG